MKIFLHKYDKEMSGMPKNEDMELPQIPSVGDHIWIEKIIYVVKTVAYTPNNPDQDAEVWAYETSGDIYGSPKEHQDHPSQYSV